jgi:hypothetical protein
MSVRLNCDVKQPLTRLEDPQSPSLQCSTIEKILTQALKVFGSDLTKILGCALTGAAILFGVFNPFAGVVLVGAGCSIILGSLAVNRIPFRN